MEGLQNVYKRIFDTADKIIAFKSNPQDWAASHRKVLKDHYDLIKKFEPERKGAALPKLLIENFDDEQIFQQIELQTKDIETMEFRLTGSESFGLADSDPESDDGTDESQESEEETEMDEEDRDKDGDESSEEEDDDMKDLFPKSEGYDSDESEEEVALKRLLDQEEGSEGEEEEEENSEEEQEEELLEKQAKHNRGIKRRTTEVDDKFFKMDEMEAFLNFEDQKEEKKNQNVNNDSDEDIDYWAEDKEEEGQSSRFFKYKDFFNVAEDVNEPPCKRVRFSQEDEAEESDGERSRQHKDLLSSDSEGDDQVKSTFERRQVKVKERTAMLEAQNLAPKPWQLTGEVEASKRPSQSLLEEDIDYDTQSKSIPIITEDRAKSLTDMIVQRIKDQAWDDPVRKVKPQDTVFEYKKRLVLDSEKSKQGLAEIYEEQYLKETNEEKEEKENPEYQEVKKMLTSIFLQLDSLSNFRFTPRTPAPEIRVVNNLPAITVEDVQPVSVSEAQMLAPEEIKEKTKQQLKGDNTKTDKNRERRRKKKIQHLKAKKRAERETAPTGNAEKAWNAEFKTGKAVKLMKDGGDEGALKSSSKFFKRLQESTKTS